MAYPIVNVEGVSYKPFRNSLVEGVQRETSLWQRVWGPVLSLPKGCAPRKENL